VLIAGEAVRSRAMLHAALTDHRRPTRVILALVARIQRATTS
jgi:hypothetical protein